MKLVLDFGNSRTKWGVFEKDTLRAHGIVSASEEMSYPLENIERVGLASVVSEEEENAVLSRLYLQGLRPHVEVLRITSTPSAQGIQNHYLIPDQLGVDRWAALIAVRARTHDAALVVLSGTATTIDALNGEGEFLGGLILPGVQLMTESLAQATHGIALTSGEWVRFPRQTRDAVHSGAIQATIGAIREQLNALTRMSNSAPRLYLSGGAAPLLLEALTQPDVSVELVDNLVLEGVAILT
jgi:type III pantothenate kinase